MGSSDKIDIKMNSILDASDYNMFLILLSVIQRSGGLTNETEND